MFNTKETHIYGPYHDGSRPRMADPLHVYRTLIHEAGGDLNAVLTAAVSPEDHQRFEAEAALIQSGRVAFEMTPFDPVSGKGATEADTLAVVDAFLNWLHRFETPDETRPTSMPPTAGRQVRGIP